MNATMIAPEITRESSTEEVAAWCIANGLDGEIVGKWVWLTFDEKPSDDIRAAIKEAGFRWVRKRGQWAHNCGVRSRGGRGAHPRHKYGSIRLKQDDDK